MAKAAPQKSLDKWTKQKWRTKSGKPSTQGPKATGERYLPEKVAGRHFQAEAALLETTRLIVDIPLIRQVPLILRGQRAKTHELTATVRHLQCMLRRLRRVVALLSQLICSPTCPVVQPMIQPASAKRSWVALWVAYRMHLEISFLRNSQQI
jgi:hypothetical protein